MPGSWHLPLAVYRGGQPIGVQDLWACTVHAGVIRPHRDAATDGGTVIWTNRFDLSEG